MRSETEGDVLEVDDQVIPTRRIGRSHVRGKVIVVYKIEKK